MHGRFDRFKEVGQIGWIGGVRRAVQNFVAGATKFCILLWATGAVFAFHLAYAFSSLSFCIILYLICLLQLARAATARRAFYLGLAVGLFTAAPQLSCFWSIFGPPAIALWLLVAFWIALFVGLCHSLMPRRGQPLFRWSPALIPFLWPGLEYFRRELYFL